MLYHQITLKKLNGQLQIQIEYQNLNRLDI